MAQSAGAGSPSAPGRSPKAQPRGKSLFDEPSVGEDSLRYDSDEPDFVPFWTEHYLSDSFSFRRIIPPLEWLPRYGRTILGKATPSDLSLNGLLAFSPVNDLVAGLTVGAVLVPQSLAFAMLAGLPVQSGLYTSFMPLLTYALLGTFRQLQPGPTAVMSLLTCQGLDALELSDDPSRVAGAAFLAMLAGAVSFLLGIFRTGFIVDFMSHGVMTAFTASAGLIIGTSQLAEMLGLNIRRKIRWWKMFREVLLHLGEANLPTMVMSFSILALLLALRSWTLAAANPRLLAKHPVWRRLPLERGSFGFRALTLVAELSSLLAVLIGFFWGRAYRDAGVSGVRFVGEVQSTAFVFSDEVGAAWKALPGEGGVSRFFSDGMVQSAVTISMIGFLDTIKVGAKWAAQGRYEFDPNQELVALGAANLVSAAASGYPCAVSRTRTAVNVHLGASSLLACGLASLLPFMAVHFLRPVIAWLPRACLSPIIIASAVSAVSLKEFATAFKCSKAELFVMLSTVAVSLGVEAEAGLIVGFMLSVLKTTNDLANPNLAVLGRLHTGQFRDVRNFPHAEQLPGMCAIRMDARLNFANARKLQEFCLKAVAIRENHGENMNWCVIDFKSINHVDLTGCEMLTVLSDTLRSKGQRLILTNLKGPVSRVFKQAQIPQLIKVHGGHVCIDMQHALNIISNEDPGGAEAEEALEDMVHRVESSQFEMKYANAHQNELRLRSQSRTFSGVPHG